MMITVESVTGKRGLNDFLSVAPPLYRGIPSWVHPLDAQFRSRLDRMREPFWQHADGELFIVRQQGIATARLLVTHDRLRQDYTGEKTATFGLLEAPDDARTTMALFDEAARWAKQRGLDSLVGPLFLSIHEEVGLLVDRFESPPRLMMPYNREYYERLLVQSGFTPVRELYAYEWDIQQEVVPAARPLRENVVVRHFNRRNRSEEVKKFLQVYNDAFTGNWGFVPMTEAEAASAVSDFLRYADPALPLLAEVGGEAAGFILALPDFNELIAPCRGRLWPFGFLHILKGRRDVRNLRVMTLAVRRSFRPQGIAHSLIRQLWDTARSSGYRMAEFSYIDARNRAMRNIVEGLGARKAKTYRLFRKDLQEVR